MIDIQERALSSFEQNVFALAHCFMQQYYRVGHELLEIIARRVITIMDLLEREWLCTEGLQDFVVLPDLQFQLFLKALGIDQVQHAQSRSRRFVAVRRSDAPLGGSELMFALQNFALGIQLAVI